jgi:hypothetical protein
MPRILKLLLGFGAVAVLLFAWLFTFGMQTWIRGQVAKETKRFPGLALTPVALPNPLPSQSWGNPGACSGYLVDLPWAGTGLTVDGSNGGPHCVFNSARNMIVMIVGRPSDELNRFYVIPSYRALMEQKYFGNDPPKNDYQFLKIVLAITPDSFPRYAGWSEMDLDMKLFQEKTRIMRDTGTDDVIYSISSPPFQGFQFSAPNAKASVEVRLYNDKNKVTLQFLTTGKGTPLPQSDINSVVQSLRRDPNAVVTSGDQK